MVRMFCLGLASQVSIRFSSLDDRYAELLERYLVLNHDPYLRAESQSIQVTIMTNDRYARELLCTFQKEFHVQVAKISPMAMEQDEGQ